MRPTSASAPPAGVPGAGRERAQRDRRTLPPFLLLLGCLLLPALAGGQVPAEPRLRGRVLLDGDPVERWTVVLHRVLPDTAGEVDSTAVGPEGRFEFELPTVPDPGGRSEVYFASVRHQGILYFGSAIHRAAQLDSLYRIEVYDTTAAPTGGAEFPVAVRNLFLEEGEDSWRVVDLLQVRNEGRRTVVAPEEGVTWTYPLPPEARNFQVGQSDLAPDAVSFEGGSLRLETPVPPGERTYLIRYELPDLTFSVPLPGRTERIELLVQEPAPALTVSGLTRTEPVEMEPGTSYRRFTGSELTGRVLEVSHGDEGGGAPVAWIAVVLGLVLAAAGIYAVRKEPAAAGPEPGGADSREDVLLRIAELDRRFEAEDPSPSERERYRSERRRLKARLREWE